MADPSEQFNLESIAAYAEANRHPMIGPGPPARPFGWPVHRHRMGADKLVY